MHLQEQSLALKLASFYGGITLKAKILLLCFVIAVLAVPLYLAIDHENGVDQIYLLPPGYEGCVIIYYNVEDAPPLQMENNQIVYEVPHDGIIQTSSPYHFGWVNKEHSGAHQKKAYYIHHDTEKITELPQKDIRFAALGRKEDNGLQKDYYYQIFGSEEIEKRGCPQRGV